MVQILPEQPTFLSQFGTGLGKGFSSGIENIQKQLAEQRKSAKTQKQNILKERAKLNSSLSSLQKTYEREGLLSDEEKDLLKEQAEALIQQGYPAELALDMVFKQSRQQEPAPLSQQEIVQRDKLPPGPQQGLFPALFQYLTQPSQPGLSTVEQRQKSFEEGPSPIREPMSFLQGAAENPLANLMAALSDPLTAGIRAAKQGPRSFIEPPIKVPKTESETEKQKKTREFGSEITTAALTGAGPIGELIGSATGGLLKVAKNLLGKLKPRDLKILNSSIKQAAKKAGVTEAEAASKLVSELEGKELLSKAEVNPKDTREILKTARAFKEEGTFPVKEAEKSIQEQRKLAKRPTVQRQMETEKARKSARKSPPSEEALKETSQKSLPRSRKNYFEAAKERRAIEDSLKLKEKKYTQSDLARAQSNEKFAVEDFKKNQYEALTGKKYNTKWTNEQAAYKTVQEIEDIAKDSGKNIADELKRIRARGYQFKNPELTKAANEALKNPLKGRASTNQFVKVNEDYANTFLKKLNSIDKEIKAIGKKPSLSEFERLGELQREREMLTEILGDTRKKVALGEKREVLAQIDERLATQKKLLGSEVKGFENLTEEELKAFNLTKEKLGKVEKAATDFITESEAAVESGSKAPKDSLIDAIRKVDKAAGKKTRSLKWLNLSAPYWIQQGIKKATGIIIPRRIITTALGALGIGGKLSVPKLKQAARVSKFAHFQANNNRSAAEEYRKKLIQSGISPITVKKYQKLAAQSLRKAA